MYESVLMYEKYSGTRVQNVGPRGPTDSPKCQYVPSYYLTLAYYCIPVNQLTSSESWNSFQTSLPVVDAVWWQPENSSSHFHLLELLSASSPYSSQVGTTKTLQCLAGYEVLKEVGLGWLVGWERRSGHGHLLLGLRNHPSIRLTWLRETMKNLSWDGRRRDRVLKPAPLESHPSYVTNSAMWFGWKESCGAGVMK